MNKFGLFSGILLTGIFAMLSGCDIETESIVNPTEFTFSYDIEYKSEEDAEEWEAVFADFPIDQEDTFELSFRYDTLPGDLLQQGAFRISGNNINADLFFFLRKEVGGLKPNTTYHIFFNIKLASQYPVNSIGSGPSQGASVAVLVGALPNLPSVSAVNNKVVPNFEYQIPNQKGEMTEDVLNIGNVGIEGESITYSLITRTNEDIPFTETTDKDGNLWVIVGIDSNFKGITTLYIDQIDINFRENSSSG